MTRAPKRRSPLDKTERNTEIMAQVARGWTQRSIAKHWGISLGTTAEIIARERARAPIDKTSAVATQAEILDHLIEEASKLVELAPMPVTAGKDGDYVLDPSTGEVARDHGQRLAAMAMVRQLQERKAKLLGLDSAVKTEVSGHLTYTIEGVDPEDVA